jgi:uncharacterized protein
MLPDSIRACLQGKKSKIIQTAKIEAPLTSPSFLMGFPGVGMIGIIVATELIQKIEDVVQIGYLVSEDLPPISIFYDGELKHPFRIYYTKKYNMFVSICEVPFQNDSYSDLTRTLLDWAMTMKVKEVIAISGVATQVLPFGQQEYTVYGAAEKPMLAKLAESGVQKLQKGLIMGVEAAVLNECLNNLLDGILLMVEAHPQIPAPEGAIAIIAVLNSLYGIDVDTTNLIEEGNQIKQKLMELANKTQQMSLSEGDGRPPSSPNYNFYS